MSSQFTLHRTADGVCFIVEAGVQHTPSGFKPRDVFEETVLDALVALLNGRREKYRLSGRALEALGQADVPEDDVLRYLFQRAYNLYIRMRRDDGLEGWRP